MTELEKVEMVLRRCAAEWYIGGSSEWLLLTRLADQILLWQRYERQREEREDAGA